MGPFVPFQPGRHFKLCRAFVTLVHLVLVRVQVIMQPRHLTERGRTLLALERLLAGVGSHVRFEKTRVPEAQPADVAFEEFVLGVTCDVILELCLVSK